MGAASLRLHSLLVVRASAEAAAVECRGTIGLGSAGATPVLLAGVTSIADTFLASAAAWSWGTAGGAFAIPGSDVGVISTVDWLLVGSGVAAEATVASRSSGDRATPVPGTTPVHDTNCSRPLAEATN